VHTPGPAADSGIFEETGKSAASLVLLDSAGKCIKCRGIRAPLPGPSPLVAAAHTGAAWAQCYWQTVPVWHSDCPWPVRCHAASATGTETVTRRLWRGPECPEAPDNRGSPACQSRCIDAQHTGSACCSPVWSHGRVMWKYFSSSLSYSTWSLVYSTCPGSRLVHTRPDSVGPD
jgi:hypothetical protein